MLTLQSRVLPEVSSLHQSIRDRVLASVALLREAASDDINELSELFLARVRPRKESQESVERVPVRTEMERDCLLEGDHPSPRDHFPQSDRNLLVTQTPKRTSPFHVR